MKTISLTLALFLSVFGLPATADPRFPVLQRIDPPAAKAMADLLAWQRSFDDMLQTDLVLKLGRPDKTESVGLNPVSRKPMQALVYRVSRRSDVRFTIHEGRVAAVTVSLLPSANEQGPLDD